MATNPRPNPQDVDPLDYEQIPSVSFRDAEIGTFYEGIIVKKPTLLQSRDFESGEPATWSDGNPKLSVVIHLDINGEKRSLWAPKPSAMFVALVAAQKEAGGQPMREGGTLGIKYTGSIPNAKNSKLNPAKQYVCRYSPPPVQDVLAEPSPSTTSTPSPATGSTWSRPTAVPGPGQSAPAQPVRPPSKW